MIKEVETMNKRQEKLLSQTKRRMEIRKTQEQTLLMQEGEERYQRQKKQNEDAKIFNKKAKKRLAKTQKVICLNFLSNLWKTTIFSGHSRSTENCR